MSSLIAAVSYGPEVEQLAGQQGEVSAVLRDALYLGADNGAIVGVVSVRAPEGPITLRVRDIGTLLRAPGVRAGARFVVAERSILLDQIAIDLSTAHSWSSPSVVNGAAWREVEQAAHKLQKLLFEFEASGGMAPLAQHLPAIVAGDKVENAKGDAFARLALPRSAALAESLHTGNDEASAIAAQQLLGLGPGFTPSGDDFLCAILAAARWLDQGDPLQSTRLLAEAATRTTRLSRRLMEHATCGLLYHPAMELGRALFAGQPAAVAGPTLRLLSLGHTSGADIATGLLFAALLWGGKPN